ncbi:UNVERIFIED_CONTAM: hypothetical protein ABIC26_005166 [Paenibacillus sp. PvR008]
MQNKVLLKKMMELLLNISVVSAGWLNDGKSPYYVILMFFAITSGITLYALKKESTKEIKINTFFMFLQPFLIGLVGGFFFGKPFNMEFIIVNFLTIVLIVVMYLIFRNPYQILYDRIGWLVIIDNLIPAVLMMFLTLFHVNMIAQVLVTFLCWMFLVRVTWKFKRKSI